MFALLQRFLSNFSAQFLTLISIHSKAVIIHSTPSWRVDQLRMDSRSPSNKFYLLLHSWETTYTSLLCPLSSWFLLNFSPPPWKVIFFLWLYSCVVILSTVVCFLALNHLHLTSWRAERCCCVISGRHLTLASGFATNEGSYVSSSSDIQFSYCWFQTMSFEQASSFPMLLSYWAFQPPTLSKGSDDIVLPV